MSTIIYPSPIFGPIHSRRLGVSLGINLQPADGKSCTFDCLYCECGLNAERRTSTRRPALEEVVTALEGKLREMKAAGEALDVLTFAGNGEPTTHPQFPEIIAETARLRDEYYPAAKVSVLSNATMIHRENVREALMTVDNNILKLDTVNMAYINLVDRPQQKFYDVRAVIEDMKRFEGHCIVQTMFMTGEIVSQSADNQSVSVDNTGEEYVAPWLKALQEIRPQQVMIYTIDRETPVSGLRKASPETLDEIRDRVKALGIECTASY